MKTQSFRLPVPTISVNGFYCGSRQYKTAAARDWILTVQHYLNQKSILDKLKLLRDHFDCSKHAYEVHFKFAYPHSKFYNKKGEISAKTIDISNGEKHIIDQIFLSRYFEEVQNLNTDDRYINKMISEKVQSETEDYYIDVEITIKPLG